MAEDFVEGHGTGEVDSEHHHSGDPEEEDVPARFENVGRVESVEIGGLVEGKMDVSKEARQGGFGGGGDVLEMAILESRKARDQMRTTYRGHLRLERARTFGQGT